MTRSLRATVSSFLALLLLAPNADAAKKPAPSKAPSSVLLDTATGALKQLRADKKRKQLRTNWTAVIRRLERAGDSLAPAETGAIAFMRAGQAAEELSRLSRRKADALRAAELYLDLADKCPRSPLRDDALVEAADLFATRLGDDDAARQRLKQAVALKGDRQKDAKRALRALDRDTAPSHGVVETPEIQVSAKIVPPPAPVLVPVPNEELPSDREIGMLIDRSSEPAALPAPSKQVMSHARTVKKQMLADTEFSPSEQLGLKVRRIVVDAGHGGHDTGAIGPTGAREKDVTLAVAKSLAETLSARGYEVIQTRPDDTFVSLNERANRANRERADLFISVHANAHRSSKKHGVETYSLNVASNRYAMRLAARENASADGGVNDLQILLADFATRANTVDSARLADTVQDSILGGVAPEFGRPRDLGTKQALFYVLLGTRMPAILVETAFLSNPDEEAKLVAPEYQQALAKSIADGVDRFASRRVALAQADE